MSHKATGVKGGKGSAGLRPDTDIPIRNMSQQYRAPAECTCTGGLPCVIALWVSMSKQQISFEWLIWNKVAQETSGDECLLPRAKKTILENTFGIHFRQHPQERCSTVVTDKTITIECKDRKKNRHLKALYLMFFLQMLNQIGFILHNIAKVDICQKIPLLKLLNTRRIVGVLYITMMVFLPESCEAFLL